MAELQSYNLYRQIHLEIVYAMLELQLGIHIGKLLFVPGPKMQVKEKSSLEQLRFGFGKSQNKSLLNVKTSMNNYNAGLF